MRPFVSWESNAPYYVLERNQLIRKGSFNTGRNLTNRIYSFFAKSQILKYFQIDLPPFTTRNDVELTCNIIAESRKRFNEKFKNDGFYVLFYPGSRYASRMFPCLQQHQVKYLDYSRLFDPRGKDLVISKNDPHPSSLAYRRLASQLVQDLDLRANLKVR